MSSSSTDIMPIKENDSIISSSSNILEDNELINLIKQEFNETDMELFKLNYEIYKTYKNNKNDYIVDLDKVYKFIGFSTKQKSKDLLKKHFEINKDYIISKISLNQLVERYNTKGGENKEYIYLKINTFKKICMLAATKQSHIIYDYYIKMEDIINNYIEKKIEEQTKILEENKKIIEIKDKLLEIKDEEINKIKNIKYEEVEKLEYISRTFFLKMFEIPYLKSFVETF